MEDVDRLKAVLDPLPVGARVKLHMRIQAGPHRAHTTLLNVSRDDDGLISIENSCIMVRDDETEISANSADKRCFDPVLTTDPADAPEPRITQTDVLQVVKTKLAIATSPPGYRIRLTDAAQIRDVRISAFNLLRQKAAIYEKYGYFAARKSADIIAAFSGLHWGHVKDVSIAMEGQRHITAAEVVTAILGAAPADGEPLHVVMKRISLEDEGGYNRALKARLGLIPTTSTGLSYELMRGIFRRLGIAYQVSYTLDPTSPNWLHWANLIQITEASFVAQGGSRITRGRSPLRSQNRSVRSRVRGRGGRRATHRRVRIARRAQ
jgi:hypothetical protein